MARKFQSSTYEPVNSYVARSTLIGMVENALSQQRCAALIAESGFGKHQVALVILKRAHQRGEETKRFVFGSRSFPSSYRRLKKCCMGST